jgi:hypothetical protein
MTKPDNPMKLDPRFAHLLPRNQTLRGEVPKGESLHSEFVLADEDPYKTTTMCKTCRKPLWVVTLRVDDKGRLLSTKTDLLVKGMDVNEPTCPLCNGLYFDVRADGTPRFLTSKGTL